MSWTQTENDLFFLKIDLNFENLKTFHHFNYTRCRLIDKEIDTKYIDANCFLDLNLMINNH